MYKHNYYKLEVVLLGKLFSHHSWKKAKNTPINNPKTAAITIFNNGLGFIGLAETVGLFTT